MKKEKHHHLERERGFALDLYPETKKSVLAIIFFFCALIFSFSAFGYAGRVGNYLYIVFYSLLGVGFFLVPLSLLLVGMIFLYSLKTNKYVTPFFGGGLFLLSFIGLMDTVIRYYMPTHQYPVGFLGYIISYPFLYLFGFWVSFFFFILFLIIAFSISFNVPVFFKSKQMYPKREQKIVAEISEEVAPLGEEEEKEVKEKQGIIAKIKGVSAPRIPSVSVSSSSPSKKVAEFIVETHQQFYQIPPIDLLEKDTGKPNAGDVNAYAHIIQKTLKHFDIEVEMGEINVGPTVTQYTLKPAEGIKLSRIVALQNDLALSLAAHPIRIEAPIPGRSLVGIEIPNKVVSLVCLRNMIDSVTFTQASPLTIALGRDVSGNAQYMDIEKMPHLLIAGATGSGKSICLHTILTSILYKNFPQMVKMIMIDPKRVELAVYNGIPHLLAPLIVDRDKAVSALRWATREMERRYEYLAQSKVRNIASYNTQATKKKGEESIMPYILIVIDELADLMMTAPKEVEAAIVRLAQMSRAVGIHLIISTQRPSVEIITGLIKANIPCRIAFQVASLVDSRTILDMSGAEKLLSNGDMLFLPPDASKPRRIQGAFVAEKEVKRITDYIRASAQLMSVSSESEDTMESIAEALEKPQRAADFASDVSGEGGDDEALLREAKKVIIEAKKASASLLQRRLKLGYARAARLIDALEEEGVIGPQDGAKPREVYL